ncbi:holin family protein [Marivita sp.]|uniref:holin family protein n=1 Tax=Marivita sp. TaxID=2003365 RepID=UPI003F6BE123
MGLIEQVFSLVFGSGRNVLKDTVEVFRPNAEADAKRNHDQFDASLNQFAAEFYAPQRGWFDRLMDALNRVPRPAMALGTLGLFIAAMVDPVWFSARMAGIALVSEPLWWLLGAIVSFYFGARHQAKGQEFQRDIVSRMSPAPPEISQVPDAPANAKGTPSQFNNAALEDWQRLRRGS